MLQSVKHKSYMLLTLLLCRDNLCPTLCPTLCCRVSNTSHTGYKQCYGVRTTFVLHFVLHYAAECQTQVIHVTHTVIVSRQPLSYTLSYTMLQSVKHKSYRL